MGVYVAEETLSEEREDSGSRSMDCDSCRRIDRNMWNGMRSGQSSSGGKEPLTRASL